MQKAKYRLEESLKAPTQTRTGTKTLEVFYAAITSQVRMYLIIAA